ncbi:cyclic nucleotide-binding domain-containing protein [uncultured Psychroserpens sp.]|uniref:Crp/Fnr family transcriptional regulator n=1 Tax=uncultured Psychroserpens sp. TaxID=255436 RepID=UPI00260E6587|nr:cyclic nucleotide-binding domain-containing protein [uncultured Psychroserpens sp.]
MSRSKIHFEKYLRSVVNGKCIEQELIEILNSFESVQLSRNAFFVQEGMVCSYFCFVESGVLQHSITISGEEKTTYLALKNTCTSALKSFKNCSPSRKNIKAISKCDLWVIKQKKFKQLLKSNKTFKRFYYNLIENQIFLIDDYRIDLLTLSPEERYKKLLNNEPKLLKEVPLHYLASFLGISSRHMSRIRKNVN